MTLIIGLKKDNEVWLAADSFWGQNGQRAVGFSDTSKIVQFKNFSIGIHGKAIFRDAAEELVKSYKAKIEDKQDARIFAKALFSKIKELEEAGLRIEDECAAEGGFVIATKDKIFKVWNNMSCFEIDQFYSNWSEADILLNQCYRHYNLNLSYVINNVMEQMVKLNPGYICEPFDIRKIT